MELVLPSPRYRASFLAAEQELVASGEEDAPDVVVATTFDALLDKLARYRAGDVGPGKVPDTTLWLVERDAFIARISIRHALNERLRYFGGHIGYAVRPSRRREGHGTRMLGLAIPHVRALGIDPAYITADADNIASRKIIEHHGGRLDAQYDWEGTQRVRYLLATRESPTSIPSVTPLL